jgi:hypothetical protein
LKLRELILAICLLFYNLFIIICNAPNSEFSIQRKPCTEFRISLHRLVFTGTISLRRVEFDNGQSYLLIAVFWFIFINWILGLVWIILFIVYASYYSAYWPLRYEIHTNRGTCSKSTIRATLLNLLLYDESSHCDKKTNELKSRFESSTMTYFQYRIFVTTKIKRSFD